MDLLREKYRAFAVTSLAMAQTASSMKEIAALLDVAQFWVQLTEWTSQEMGAEAQSA